MKTAIQGKAKLRVIDRESGSVIHETQWQKNLVLDVGLNTLASGQSNFAAFFTGCKVGSSNTPNVIGSGAVTFTQVGTTITASGSFFTSAMTGAILKYGTGSSGIEQYITFVNATTATTTTSNSAVAEVGTVYIVQATGLTSYFLVTTAVQTGSGNNGTTISGNQITSKRTFNFANQGSTYNVNEVGYSVDGSNNATVNGRIVLTSTVTVTPTQFLQIVLQLTYLVTPSAPVSVANVGTNLNTAGTAGYLVFDFEAVTATGANTSFQGNGADMMDACELNGSTSGLFVGLTGGAITIPGSIPLSQSNVFTGLYILGGSSISNAGQAVGVGLGSFTYSLTTAGETCFGLMFGTQTASPPAMRAFFALNFTTPQTLPVGTFAGNLQFTLTFTRTLNN